MLPVALLKLIHFVGATITVQICRCIVPHRPIKSENPETPKCLFLFWLHATYRRPLTKYKCNRWFYNGIDCDRQAGHLLLHIWIVRVQYFAVYRTSCNTDSTQIAIERMHICTWIATCTLIRGLCILCILNLDVYRGAGGSNQQNNKRIGTPQPHNCNAPRTVLQFRGHKWRHPPGWEEIFKLGRLLTGVKWGLALADVTFEAQFAGEYFNFLPVLGDNFREIETKNFKKCISESCNRRAKTNIGHKLYAWDHTAPLMLLCKVFKSGYLPNFFKASQSVNFVSLCFTISNWRQDRFEHSGLSSKSIFLSSSFLLPFFLSSFLLHIGDCC